MVYKKVNKPTARKLYNNGITVYLLPCKVSEVALTSKNSWVNPIEISLLTCAHSANKFDRTVNEYEYYNCNAELGYYPHYFVLESDYMDYKVNKAMEVLSR